MVQPPDPGDPGTDTKQDDWGRVKEQLDRLKGDVGEICRASRDIKEGVKEVNGSLQEAAKKATPMEKLLGIGSALVVGISTVFLLGGLLAFNKLVEFLAGLPNASASGLSSSGGTILLASEQLTLNQPESPASSLGWVAGLGFSAFALGVAIVGVGALVVLARAGRDDM